MSADNPAGIWGQGPTVRGEGLRRSYRRRCVLDIDEIEAPAGRTLALLGTSGAGKSTLLRILGLLEQPSAGRVLFDGREMRAGDAEARMTTAAVFQKPYLFSGTVGRNVAFGLRLRRVPAPERKARVAAALGRVGLAGWESRSALTLSGGEAQRVALARALVLRPRLLLLDEPLSYLDPLIKRQLTSEFATILRETGVTAIYVTHDQDEAMVVADTVAILHEGRILQHGRTERVMSVPGDEWVAVFVGMEPPIRGCAVARDEGVVEVRLASGASLFGVGDVAPGSEAVVAVRPEDVMLFAAGESIPHSSARNRMDAEVVEVVPKGAMVRIVLACGSARIASLVSRASVSELGLVPGARVVALFKAAATRVAPLPA